MQLELLHVRNEYVKLYNLYETEKNCRSKLNEDYKEALETIAATETAGHNLQELKSENRKLSEKVENKSLEIKKLKSEIETE